MAGKPAAFKATPKQRELLRMLKQYKHAMAEGGSRSGKTFGLTGAMFARALRVPSRHLIARRTGVAARRSLWKKTIPDILRIRWPTLKQACTTNEQAMTLELPCSGGGHSIIEVAGLDNKERVEKILGNEYSTVWFNECSEIPYDSVLTVGTRLAEKNDLVNRMWYDQNPPRKSHWTYKLFHEGKDPIDNTPIADWEELYAFMQMNPTDNVSNIDPDYIAMLERMPRRKRERFLYGLYQSSVDGAFWNDEMLAKTRVDKDPGCDRYVVALDVAVSTTEGSDETGLGVAGQLGDQFYVVEDRSGKYSPNTWARNAIDLYHQYNAAAIVVETNQGGNMIKHTINEIDHDVNVVEVHAKKGKLIRAEPVANMWEMGRGHICGELIELEDQLCTYTLDTKDWSPDRLDWMVYAVLHLMGQKEFQSMIL